MDGSPRGLPLSQRRADWFFVVVFALFTCTSLVSDLPHALGWTTGALADANAAYARAAGDAYFASNPVPLRVRLMLSAFLFPFITTTLSYAFARGLNGVRPLALMYGAVLGFGVVEFFGWEYLSGQMATNLPVFLGANGPYLLVPILLVLRMWRPMPFGTATDARAGHAA